MLSKMTNQGVLEQVQPSPSFVSPMFLARKSNGTARPIFNLKSLNDYVLTDRFRLINMHRIPDFLQPFDWICKIDLSQAYFHVPIIKQHRRFLRLVYNQRLFEMTCLPFGLSTAPKVFASLTNWIAQILREKSLRIIVYLDDYLLAHQDPTILASHTEILKSTLQDLGFQINLEKSVLIPQKSAIYLGIMWKPWINQKSLPNEKVATINRRVDQLLRSGKTNLKELQSLSGLLNFASFVVPRGRLNHRMIQKFLISLPENVLTKTYALPKEVQTELSWWALNCPLPSVLHVPPTTHYLTTDASDVAWGAQLNNLPLSGTWELQEQRLHCNEKEILAILKVLQVHAPNLEQASLMIQSDSKTAVAYLRNEGGTKSLRLLNRTYQIFQILDQYQIKLKIYHIPGKYNEHADHLSRHRRLPEWHLLPACTDKIFAKWGTPVLDLFASKTAHVVSNYVSLDLKDHQAIFHDALSVSWTYPLAWVFPPPFLIPRVLAHLNQATGTYLLVLPRWEKVFWRADVKTRALDAPITLWNLERILIDTTTNLPPPKVQDLILEVWKCGGGRKT